MPSLEVTQKWQGCGTASQLGEEQDGVATGPAVCHRSGRDVEPGTGDCELTCAMLGTLSSGAAEALLDCWPLG